MPDSDNRSTTAKDMTRSDWRGLASGLFKFLYEEAREPEHREKPAVDYQPALATSPNSAIPAAGTMLVDPKRRVLFVRYGAGHDHAGEWAFPGGRAEDGESASEAAAREAREETGYDADPATLQPVDRRELEGVDFSTYAHPVAEAFEPRLSAEHDDYRWAPLGDVPEPLHPGARATLVKVGDKLLEAEDAGQSERKRPRYTFMAMDPLTKKGQKILRSMEEEYGEEKGKSVFYASKNAEKIKGVDSKGWRSPRWSGAADRPIAQDRAPDFGTPYDPREGMAYVRLAFDFDSVRRRDADGRLHVRAAHISKAIVNPYYGWEIPDYEELGLKRDKRYNLLRDPKELERAVPTFNNIQVLDKHVPVSSDRAGAHLPDITIGSTGTDAAYRHPYLDNSLVIWDPKAIADVENNRRRELSCAYRYKPDMTPGVYEGQSYDGVMRDIVANHLCLVREGRAGSDVVIGDEKMREIWRSPRFTTRV